jgi:hypothetical protein
VGAPGTALGGMFVWLDVVVEGDGLLRLCRLKVDSECGFLVVDRKKERKSGMGAVGSSSEVEGG